MMRLLTIVVVVLGTLVAVTEPASAALPKWHVAATLSLGTDGVAVDCGATSACWSLEAGRLLSSSDGGQSWTDRTDLVPTGIASLDDLDCLAAQRCYLAATDTSGNALLLLLDHGTITQHAIPGAPTLSAISCTAPAHCVGATGTTSYVTDDGGATWSQASLGRTLLGKTAVDCIARTTVCYLVGNYGLVPTILKSQTRGRSWTMQTAPYNDGGIYDIDCPSIAECYATGAGYSDYALVIRTVDGGAHWTFASGISHAYPLRSISCPASLTCTAVGHSPGQTPFVFATTDGQNWQPQTIAPIATAQPAHVFCPTTQACTVVASAAAFVTTDSGATWQTVEVPVGVEAPQDMSCSTGRRCVGIGSDAAGQPFVITTSDFGTTWSPGTLPSGIGRPGGIDCPTKQTCYALGVVPVTGTPRSNTKFLRSTDGGATWMLVATRTASMGAITCPTETTCFATGYDNRSRSKTYVTTDSGVHWLVVSPPATTTLLGIACGTATSCIFIMGTYGGEWTAYTTDDLGASYEPHPMPAHDWYSVDCAGSFCMVAGSEGGYGAIATSSDGGVTWEDETVPPQAQLVSDVSCGSPTSCAASTFDFTYNTGGPRIVGTTDGGATWNVRAVPARNEAPFAVGCFGARCIAADYSTTGNPIIVAGTA